MEIEPNTTTSTLAPDAVKDVSTTSTPLPKPPSRRARSFLGYGLAFFFAAAAFFSGMQVGAVTHQQASFGSLVFGSAKPKDGVDLELFWQVWQELDQKFVISSTSTKPMTDQERVWGAIDGLVRTYGDPYTIFMPPKDAQLFESNIAGEFGGVGMEVGMQNDVITVIAPLPDSPAEKAGVLSGDVVTKIDGESTEHMGVDEAVLKIRGEKGSKVHLTLYRKGEETLIEKEILRDTINIPTLKTEEKDGVFVIHLYNFSANSEEKMQEAFRTFSQSKDTKMIIDLRGNPGGYLESAVGIASYFLPTGKVVVRESFGGGKEETVHRSLGRDLFKSHPYKVVVLVDQGSASASEILAGALQEQGIAKLVGTRTFGKGSVQELTDLPGGSTLKVTIARWLTPNGHSISSVGITPDVQVDYTKADRDAKKDPQLDKAIEVVKGK